MTVYLGTHGEIELKRVFDGEFRSIINTADVNATEKRFSLDFDLGRLITGDKVEITSIDDPVKALDFVTNHTDSSIKKFVHVDDAGGIRLYNTFALAVTGGSTNAIPLSEPTSPLKVKIKVEESGHRVLAQVSSFEINTERETVDTTVLSDEFRTRVNTLISGSGRITAFWEYTGDTTKELPNYLYELVHRTKVGSNFEGQFYIKKGGYNPSGVAERSNDEVYWEVEGIITSAALQFAPDNTVQITADFITTGEIKLIMDLEPPLRILQEDSSSLQSEQDADADLATQQQ
jgi:hypothetical protein